jgi:thioredoxin 1
MAGDNTLNFTDGSFDQEVLRSDVPVLVDFWAPWCGPCKAMTPTIDAVATEYLGKIKIGKMNTDDNPSTPMRYQVRGIPTLILFKGGLPVDQRVGALPKPDLKKMLDPHVGPAVPVPVKPPQTESSSAVKAPQAEPSKAQ